MKNTPIKINATPIQLYNCIGVLPNTKLSITNPNRTSLLKSTIDRLKSSMPNLNLHIYVYRTFIQLQS